MKHISALAILLCAGLSGCDEDSSSGEPGAIIRPPVDPYPSTYAPEPSTTTLIRGATILIGDGQRIEKGAVLIKDGVIAAIGADEEIESPDGDVAEVDATGKWITPGIIDIHSHLGVYPAPQKRSTSDGNEMTDPNTAHVWAEHSVWPQDPGFSRALAGGVTAMQILPGSANLFGGRSVALKNVPSRTVQGMKFPGAPYGLKMACGENPKRVYGTKERAPSTRMGNFAGYRSAWIAASDYRISWKNYLEKAEAGEAVDAPTQDLNLETLAAVLDGDIIVNMHCYRADEMAQVLDMAKEFGYRVTAFHHAVESYKIADLLAEADVCSAIWADWWGFKLEAYDAIDENAALLHKAGACAIIHSDSPYSIQRLNQEAAKAMAAGTAIGIDVTPEQAIGWITANPAKAMGIGDRTGSLEIGKMADVVVWNGDPFSVYSLAELVFIDGTLRFDRNDPALSPRSDFEIGHQENGTTGGAGQ